MMDFHTFIQQNYTNTDIMQGMYITNQGIKTNYFTAGNLAVKPGINAYMSMNPIGYCNGTIRRDTAHVKRLKWLYIDLDTYKTLYSKDQILMNLEENYFGWSIPAPSQVVDSGRGLYLLWKIDENVKASSRWLKVQKYLYEILKEFGADRSVVTDQARVLRQIGSINSKSGTVVKVIRNYQNTYTLYEIMQEYLPEPTINKKEIKTKVYTIGTSNTMLVSRLQDLETLLLQHRDADHAKRENILFLYRYWNLCLTGDKENSLQRVMELNSKLQHPLPEREATRATRSAERYYNNGCSFRMRNATLIDFLDISQEEQKDLYTIISGKEKKERKKERNKRAYLRQLSQEGKQTKDKQIKGRQRAIWKLLKEGKGQKEICKELNISRSTFYADKKVIECTCDTINIERKELKENRDMVLPDAVGSACPENSALVLKDDSPMGFLAVSGEKYLEDPPDYLECFTVSVLPFPS